MYYIYIYLDPRKPASYGFDYEPFYIGKGKQSGYRDKFHLWEARKTKGRCTNHRINRIRGIFQDGLEPVILRLYEELTHEEACNKEIELIATIGRQDLEKGPLLNLTDGGEGTAGRVYSDETRRKISESHADFSGENHPSWGMKRSAETRKRIGATSKGRKHSEETKKKISENTKQALATRK
jgi:hypothetical protein